MAKQFGEKIKELRGSSRSAPKANCFHAGY
jgi:hypothetical protein